jgi:lipopolysaccharide biosynthesis protein
MSEVQDKPIRLVAYYLPQYHPFPENDDWWGKGFTEWTNVTRAHPLFVGHYQPHLPADLGFYDLRVPEVRHEQIRMAKDHGIDAFCYHFYWFSGKRLMERPLDDMLADKEADMPFCLCWANENWTRRWDASENEILIAQKYRPEDPVASLQAMEPFLRDPRYITYQGRKVIVVYRPQHLPDSVAWLKEWRDYAREVGLGELHLVCALTHDNWSYETYGFDAGVEFPPHSAGRVRDNVGESLGYIEPFEGLVLDYSKVAEFYLNRDMGLEDNVHRTVYPSWDNTARRKQLALVTLNGTPENYEYWLHRAIKDTQERHTDGEGMVFINAWNEWAEGCHLEPDRKYGHAFLEATLRAKQGTELTAWTHVGLPPETLPEAQHEHAAKLTGLLSTEYLRALFVDHQKVKSRNSLKRQYQKIRSDTRATRHAIRGFFRRLKGKAK